MSSEQLPEQLLEQSPKPSPKPSRETSPKQSRRGSMATSGYDSEGEKSGRGFSKRNKGKEFEPSELQQPAVPMPRKSIEDLLKEAEAFEKEVMVLKTRLFRNGMRLDAEVLSMNGLSEAVKNDLRELETRRVQLMNLFAEISAFAGGEWVDAGKDGEISKQHQEHYLAEHSARIAEARGDARDKIARLNEAHIQEKLARKTWYKDGAILTAVGGLGIPVLMVNLMVDGIQSIIHFIKTVQIARQFSRTVKSIDETNSRFDNKEKNSLLASLYHSQAMLFSGALHDIAVAVKDAGHSRGFQPAQAIKGAFNEEKEAEKNLKETIEFEHQYKRKADAVGDNDPDSERENGNSRIIWGMKKAGVFFSDCLPTYSGDVNYVDEEGAEKSTNSFWKR